MSVKRVAESEEHDRYNNAVKTVTETVQVPAWFSWTASTEDNTDRETRQTQATIVVGSETDIEATDQVEFDGLTFRVEGRPIDVYDKHGLHHRIVYLKVFEG